MKRWSGLGRRALVLAGAGGALPGALAACGLPWGAPAGPAAATVQPGAVELWFSVGKEREPMMLEISRGFEAAAAGVTVTWEHAPSDGALRDKLVTTSAAGSPPDVAQLNAPFVPLLVAGGALADLDALAARDRGFKLGEVFEAAGLSLARKLTTDERLYALPRGAGLLHYFYNRDAFAQQGLKDPIELYDAKQWTWAAAVSAATALTRRSGDAVERYGHAADFTIQRAVGIVAANGGRLFDEGSKRFVFADDAASVDAVQWTVDLKDRHRVAQPYPPPDGEPASAQTLFASGKAAMFHGLATYLAAMTPVIGTTFRYAIAPMPVARKEATYGNASGGMGVFKAGKRPDLGWEVAKHFAGTDAFVTSMKHNYVQVPLLNDRRAKESFLASGVYGIDRVLKHAATSVTETFAATNLGDIRNVFDREATAIWRGTAAVRPALATAQREMQGLYDAGAGR